MIARTHVVKIRHLE